MLDVDHCRDSAERIRVGTSFLASVIKMAVTRTDEVFGTRIAPAALPALLRAHLDGVEPPMPPQRGDEYLQESLRRSDLVAQHLAVRLPPVADNVDRITVHPDIPFALRLTDRPAPADDDVAAHLETDEYRPLLIRDIRPGDLVR